MAGKKTTNLKSIIKKLFDANAEYHKFLHKDEKTHYLGDPCTVDAITQFENDFGIMFPPSYREFLLLHNGWKNFSGEYTILSLELMKDERVIDHIEHLRDLQLGLTQEKAANGFVIGCGESTSYTLYLDLEAKREDGEMDIVEHDLSGEIKRHPDFVSLIEDKHRIIMLLLPKDRKKPAKPAAKKKSKPAKPAKPAPNKKAGPAAKTAKAKNKPVAKKKKKSF
jgi:cell wall assembly regulator SMI1